MNCHVLQTDLITAEMYANIKSALLRKGKPIPENDIWIAAFACQYNLPLYTADKHFEEIGEIILHK
ncbi:PIN domain-containing protein [Chitinophaga sp. HK235]|uniref:PIN domain-containing protein n=1 Tax=Chitinophaga sp. HK235 TaxID=2952571 RepID=UPI001BA76D53